ncbi:LamG domain-containing protein [Verrucomicrobiaceae bacterium R5-34]|nr:LamG domain-containing protein [Verrucomicrobiaceae bacterium R5-34]
MSHPTWIATMMSGAAALLGCLSSHAAISPEQLNPQDYTFGYWANGMRKHADDRSRDVLCIETGHFGLALDLAQLDRPRFATFRDGLDYAGALAADQERMRSLDPASLEIEVEKDGKVYRAVSSQAADPIVKKRLSLVRMWESARYVQHYDLQQLVLRNPDGEQLSADAKLSLVAWPDSVSFTAEIAPAVSYQDGPALGVQHNGHAVIGQPLVIPHQPELEHETFTVESWVMFPKEHFGHQRGWILCKNRNEITEGNFGFSVAGGQLSATMNIGGRGRENRFVLRSDRHSLLPAKWHHIAMSYDGATFSLYVDGKLKGSQKVGRKRVLGKGDLSIGKRADGHGGVTPVVIDQLRIWNRALSKQQIDQHARHATELKTRQGLSYENSFDHGAKVVPPTWTNTKVRLRFAGKQQQWQTSQTFREAWSVDQAHKVTLECPLKTKKGSAAELSVAMKLNQLPPVKYEPQFGCYVARVHRPKRAFKIGYTDIRDYDDIEITVRSNKNDRIPFLLEMINPGNVTGVCPILCDEHGVPTGIPVQLSKNWHEREMGSYLRSYALLPVSAGTTRYRLKFVYGFYGTLPSASHAQLSLIGYGGHGRWDQLAIGCWGETYCMDMDMSLVDVTVTDVRMLMARAGKEGKKWGWTDAGWGGDWLGLRDDQDRKLLFNGLKTAYLAHGPCLSEVRYDGFYGAGEDVDLKATVRTLRTDDYARTFTTLRYGIEKSLPAEGWLFKMGRTPHYVTPKIAYGNAAGLIKEHQPPKGLKEGADYLGSTTLTGEGPWWVAFPGAYSANAQGKATGYRALVIRSYQVRAGGKTYRQPTLRFSAFRSAGDGRPNLDCMLVAPEGVETFTRGDSVELEVEWITLPRVADDYYGPNTAFRQHLEGHPSSWETTHREARGNDLQVEVSGGTLRQAYPILVRAESDAVSVRIQGGVGYVPIRFEGLKHATGYQLYQVIDGQEVRLDQAVHGNDFWQTDYHAESQTYQRTYNLPLDGLKQSQWLLRRSR